PTGNLNVPRYLHTSTYLEQGSLAGKVLVTGGYTSTFSPRLTDTPELYDPATERFSSIGSKTAAQFVSAAVFLSEGPLKGDVLILGWDANGPTAELFEYTSPSTPIDDTKIIVDPAPSSTVSGPVAIQTKRSAGVKWLNVYVDGTHL